MRALILSLILSFAALPAAAQVLVFAASSMQTALDAVAADFEAATGTRVALSYAGSSTLARQIEAGAPAQLFISANEAWADALDNAGLVADRRDLLGNALVLVAPDPAAPRALSALPDALGDGRLAMALVDAVPAGIYGKQALTALGLWQALAPRVAQADNVRAALMLVATGAAPFGVVYASDAAVEPKVAVVARFPEDSHAPIVYPALLLAGAGDAACAFYGYLATPAAMARFEAAGFAPVAR